MGLLADLVGTLRATLRIKRAILDSAALTADRTFTLPDLAGEIDVGKLKRAAATSMAAGEFISWLVLAANSSDITGTTLTTVMTITGVGVGRYRFRCQLIYQAAVATHGVDVAVNHTGTTTQFVAEIKYSATGTTVATAAGTEISTTAAGNIYVGQGSRTKNAIIGAGVATVDTANLDMILEIDGFFVVSVTGSLEIKLAASAASLVVRAMQCSHLELMKLSS